MQLVEAAVAEQLDPAHESCAAVSSGLIGSARGAGVATGRKGFQARTRAASSRPSCAARIASSACYECLAHTCDEEPRHSLKGGKWWERGCETRRRGPSHPASCQLLG